MSQLKEIVQNSLRIRNVGPQIIASVDTLIQRAIIDLQRNDLLPSRLDEFVSLDKKEEKRDSNGELLYNFYYLPEDFRKLDYFRPRKTHPYYHTDKVYDLYPVEDANEKNIQRKFGIFDTHEDDSSKYNKILVAYPFPEDDETIEVKYYSNGKNQDWDWLDEQYWEVIISWVYTELGLRSPQELEDDLGRAVATHKEDKGHNTDNRTFQTLSGSFFGKKTRDFIGKRSTRNRRITN